MGSTFDSVLKNVGLVKTNSSIYETAFIHRSFLNESKEARESNERLEFLGDSVLSLIVSSFLFKTRARDDEGSLTSLRAYMVKTDSLGLAAKKLDLGNFLKLSKGEEVSGGRENTQILANTYEAVLGAIFLDLGMEAADKFVRATLLTLFTQEIKKGAPRDPKSELQEVIQSKFQVSPKYKVLASLGPDHAKRFTVGVFIKERQIGQGHGSNKQQAEEEAAKIALKRL